MARLLASRWALMAPASWYRASNPAPWIAWVADAESSDADALVGIGEDDALVDVDDALVAVEGTEAFVLLVAAAFSQFWVSAFELSDEPPEPEEETVDPPDVFCAPALAELEPLTVVEARVLNVTGAIRAVAVDARLAVPLRTGAAEAAMPVITRRAMVR
jgi:hypothetical protein